MGMRLIQFNGKAGILKCNHIEKEKMMYLLNSIEMISSEKVEVNTIATSGTLRSLRTKKMSRYL